MMKFTKQLSITLLFAASLYAAPKLLVCVSDDAPESLKKACKKIVENPSALMPLATLMQTHDLDGAEMLSSDILNRIDFNTKAGRVAKSPEYKKLAFNHLLVVAIDGKDPMLEKARGYFVSVHPESKRVYQEGYGHLQGNVGIVESDRNPFLHSAYIDKADIETSIFKLSGTTETAVQNAVRAFARGMLNGLVVDESVTRPEQTILDLMPGADTPSFSFPGTIGETLMLTGWTQPDETEYRAWLEKSGVEPKKLWRVKYLEKGLFNSQDVDAWLNGFHRKAWGNAVTVAEFADSEEAKRAAEKMSRSEKRPSWKTWKKGTIQGWKINPPQKDEVIKSAPVIRLVQKGHYIIMSSLSENQTVEFL